MPSKPNHGIPSRAGRPRSGGNASLRGKRLERGHLALETEPREFRRGRGALAPGQNASLRGKRLGRGHLALETEPRDSRRGRGALAPGETPRSEGRRAERGHLALETEPRDSVEGGAPSLRGKTPRSGGKRAERGHLALETEPRDSVEGGAPSLQAPGARAPCPRNRTTGFRRGRGALAPGQNASLRGLLQPLQRLEAQLAPPVALAAVGLAQARIERRLRVNDAVVRLQGGVA